MRSDPASRRAACLRAATAACTLAALAAGCSGLGRGSLDAARLASGLGGIEVSAEQIAATPYAQLLVEGDGIHALMVLGNDDAGLTSWYAGAQLVFLRDGRLAGSHGLAEDAVEIRLLGDDPFARLQSVDAPVPTRRRYDWMPGHRYGVELAGTLVPGALEDVEILGHVHRLRRFDETLAGAGLTATNTYWVEPASGRILRSRELLAPGRMLELLHVKPYRPAVVR